MDCIFTFRAFDFILVNAMNLPVFIFFAGADFIKTSTGKEGVNATLVVALVMIRAIRDYYALTGYKVSLLFSSSLDIRQLL